MAHLGLGFNCLGFRVLGKGLKFQGVRCKASKISGHGLGFRV